MSGEHFHQAGKGCCPHPDCVKATAVHPIEVKSCPWRPAYTSDKCGRQYVGPSGYCEEHDKKCCNCGKQADHGCDYCGQFVCGYPACEKCGMCSVDHGANKERSKAFRSIELKKKLQAIIDDPTMPSAMRSTATIEIALL